MLDANLKPAMSSLRASTRSVFRWPRLDRRSPTFLLPVLLMACGLLALAPVARAQSPLPAFDKAFEPSTIGPGSVSTLRFTIDNSANAVGVRNLAFTDTLPAAVTLATPANAFSTCGGTVSAPDGGSTVTFSGGQVGASSSCFVTVEVTSGVAGTHTNVSGDLTSDAGNSGSATADLTVSTDRPGFSKSFNPSSVFFGERSTLTFTIDNSANSVGMFNLNFTDPLPTGMTVASPANASTTCSGSEVTAPEGGDTISFGPAVFGGDLLAAGASCTATVDVVGGAVGELVNLTGELTSTPQTGGFARSSGKASAALTVVFESLRLTKTFTDDPVAPGGTVTLEFTLRNLDRRSSATGITFTDDLDAVLSGLAAVGLPLTDPCGAGSQLGGTSVLTLTGGNLPASGSCTFSVTLQVPSGAASGAFTNTTSDVSGDVGGQAVAGAPASDDLFVQAVPTLTKSFIDDPVGAGGSVTLEFTVTNTSPTEDATDIAFSDTFDVILPTASSVPSAGFCGPSSSASFTPLLDTGGSSQPATLTVSGASLAPGASCTFSIVLDVVVDAAGGNYPNVTGELTATVGGESVTGDPASDTLQVVAAPELIKEFTDDPVLPGDPVTLRFTLDHDEQAAGDATAITFTDDLDAALSGLVATGLPLADVCGLGSEISGTQTLTFTGGILAPGESCSFDVTLQVPGTATPGPHTNTTSVVVATVLGVEARSAAASDDLDIAGLDFSKEFIDDPVLPGGTVTLRFTLDNVNPAEDASDISFQDDLGATLSGLAATGLPLTDPCGAGSSLDGMAGNTILELTGGFLAAGTSCSFDVTLQVPGGALSTDYTNTTGLVSATVAGSTVFFDAASDELTVDDNLLALSKEFIDDPVSPGDPVTLRFDLSNLSATETITDIAFTDDLDAALSGLASTSGTLTDVCGLGSQISGTGVLSFSGGSLGPGSSCSFALSLLVPSSADLGEEAVNSTSEVTGLSGGLGVTGDPASDVLRIDALVLGKSFGGVASPGDTVSLTFTIQNQSGTQGFENLGFSDDLDAVIPGLEAVGLPAADVCGAGSQLDGTSIVVLTGGSLLPGGSCTFSLDVQVPAGATAGSFVNVTSDLQSAGLSVAEPATATLVVEVEVDSDGDGVLDGDDVCPGTLIPEGVPTRTLRPNHYALVDGDNVFDSAPPPGNGGGPGDVFTTTDTGGCSCEQIIEAAGLGNGHRRFGCSLGVMRDWVSTVGSPSGGSVVLSTELQGIRRLLD